MNQVYVVYWADNTDNGISHGIEGVYEKEEDAIYAMKEMFINEIQSYLEDEVAEVMELPKKENIEEYTDDDIQQICLSLNGSSDRLSIHYEMYDNIYEINVGTELVH